MNNPSSMCHLGIFLVDDGDHKGAFRYLSKAVESGVATAHNELSAGCTMKE